MLKVSTNIMRPQRRLTGETPTASRVQHTATSYHASQQGRSHHVPTSHIATTARLPTVSYYTSTNGKIAKAKAEDACDKCNEIYTRKDRRSLVEKLAEAISYLREADQSIYEVNPDASGSSDMHSAFASMSKALAAWIDLHATLPKSLPRHELEPVRATMLQNRTWAEYRCEYYKARLDGINSLLRRGQ